MDQLTNLYKHKCEQLQEQINNMKRMLREDDTTSSNNEPPGIGSFPPDFEWPTNGQWNKYGPRSQDFGIQPGQPGTRDHGPLSPYDDQSAPQQPLPGASQTEWNNWLDRMWQWYMNKYPFSTTNGNGDNIQEWWRIWHNIQELAPNDGGGWDWHGQPDSPNGPHRPAPKPNHKPIYVNPSDYNDEDPWQGLPFTGPNYEPDPRDWKPKPKPKPPAPKPRATPPAPKPEKPWWAPTFPPIIAG